VNRRSVSKCLLGAALSPFLRAQDPSKQDAPKQETSKLEIGGGVIEVTFAATGFDLSQAAILAWAKDAAEAVTWYFGRYPVPSAKLRIMVGRRGGVSNGTTFGEGGPRTRIAVGAHATEAELKDDWILTHEMVHYGFPSVEDNHHWIEEGSAVYIEPIARVHVGQLTPEKIWGDMVRDMPQGLPAAGDQGLDNTHTWARTYWGGALFCMLADIEIRKRTKNKKSLQDAFRAINVAGGTVDKDWPLQRAFEIGDKATGGKTLMDLWQQMGPKPMPVDLQDLWKQLGVIREGGVVTFDRKAPLAAIRAAIA
jgi:hypothetical protein